jgi:O-succinylbenzoic acid--CoA ligase
MHPDFKLNGLNYTAFKTQSLNELTAEKKAFYSAVNDFITDWQSGRAEVEVQTSGSTGKPKRIKLSKTAMRASAEATGAYFNLPAQTSAFLCLPVSYIAGKMMLVRAIHLGWHLDLGLPKSNPLDANTKQYDFSAMTPFQVSHSLKDLHGIHKLIVGGGALSNLQIQAVQALKTQVFETYGMTETITHIAARPVNHTPQKNVAFTALPQVSLSVDQRNCLQIDAPRISPNKIQTNDVVQLIDAHSFYWKGRYDRVINTGGVKVFPEVIERKLSNLIPERFFVAGLPHKDLGEQVVLVVETALSTLTEQDLYNRLNNMKNLEKYELPKKILCVAKFTETHTGKVQRQQTLASYLNKNS